MGLNNSVKVAIGSTSLAQLFLGWMRVDPCCHPLFSLPSLSISPPTLSLPLALLPPFRPSRHVSPRRHNHHSLYSLTLSAIFQAPSLIGSAMRKSANHCQYIILKCSENEAGWEVGNSREIWKFWDLFGRSFAFAYYFKITELSPCVDLP